jgi:hypothetical protein
LIANSSVSCTRSREAVPHASSFFDLLALTSFERGYDYLGGFTLVCVRYRSQFTIAQTLTDEPPEPSVVQRAVLQAPNAPARLACLHDVT